MVFHSVSIILSLRENAQIRISHATEFVKPLGTAPLSALQRGG